MGLLSSIFLPSNTIKGIDAIRGKQNYKMAYDQNQNLLCWFYDMSGLGKQIIEIYYEQQGLDKSTIDIQTKFLSNKSEEVQSMMPKKLCVLNKEILTYDVILKLSKTRTIKGLTDAPLKNVLNNFEMDEQE